MLQKPGAKITMTHQSAWRMLFVEDGKEKYNPRHKFKKFELKKLLGFLNAIPCRRHTLTEVLVSG